MKTQNFKIVSIGFFLMFFVTTTFGQNKTLVGKVTAFDSIPLAGIEIQVKSTGEKLQTDSLGRFQFICNKKDKVRFVADGFVPKNVKVEDGVRLMFVNIDLKNGENNLAKAERYMQINENNLSAKDYLFLASSEKKNYSDYSRFSNVFDAIKGQYPSVIVENNRVYIPGTRTFYRAKRGAALLVLNGEIAYPGDFNVISMEDILSINIFVDATSIQRHGGNSNNGLVMVYTKNELHEANLKE